MNATKEKTQTLLISEGSTREEFTTCPDGIRWCREHTAEGCMGPAHVMDTLVRAWLTRTADDPEGQATLVVEDAAAQVTELTIRF